MIRAAALVALLVLGGCVSYRYSRTAVDEPLAEGLWADLAPGTGLQECLDRLGPPRLVWKDPRGIWLAYVWTDERGPSFGVSAPIDFFWRPSVRYSSTVRTGTGVVLLFDEELKLRFVRRGLTDLPPADEGLLELLAS